MQYDWKKGNLTHKGGSGCSVCVALLPLIPSNLQPLNRRIYSPGLRYSFCGDLTMVRIAVAGGSGRECIPALALSLFMTDFVYRSGAGGH